jgi:aryl-alcohol dehydrogenase (NADP+)
MMEFRRLGHESLRHAQQIKARAAKLGMTAGQFALNWVLNNKLVTSVLAGPRTEGQWREYLGALDHPLDPGEDALIDRLVPPGHLSTYGYVDPKFPVAGRVVRG